MAKILVADDNSNIQKMVVLALKDQGIDVVAVGNGEAAVRKISDIRPDLVLADVFMPVRNGYEVCRYVKEDSKLSHIPVILLVGAFDPLDEQEAQRVAADGVLKKPFVPPDPLISMVKSALTRAGVSLGPAPAAEKPVPEPSRPITELFHSASAKAALTSREPIPEATPEPVEEFELPKPPVKISQGQEPVAFGSLLDTSEEEPSAVTSKPMINLAADRKWEEEPDEVREEEDEEDSSGGWRAASVDEELEKAAAPSTGGAKDWREEAFADSTTSDDPAASHWTPTPQAPEMIEAAEVPSVAVSTIETTSAPTRAPFGGDDWAAAMAAGIEDKLTEAKEAASVVPEVAPAADEKVAAPEVAPETHVESASEEIAAAEPANWGVVPETSWEMEAKRAAMLASTWDAPAAPTQDTEATQDVPIYARHAPEFYQEHIAEHGAETVSAYSDAPEVHEEAEKAPEVQTETAATVPVVEEPLQKPWEAPVLPPSVAPAALVEESYQDVPALKEHPSKQAADEEPATQSAQPDMDELVARVLQKMNPEVLKKVTQEILKPVIEAIVRNELDSKK